MTGSEFRAWRLGLGLGQAAAAVALGVSLRTVVGAEGGRPIRRTMELACQFIAEHPEIITLFGVPRRHIIPETVTTFNETGVDIPEKA